MPNFWRSKKRAGKEIVLKWFSKSRKVTQIVPWFRSTSCNVLIKSEICRHVDQSFQKISCEPSKTDCCSRLLETCLAQTLVTILQLCSWGRSDVVIPDFFLANLFWDECGKCPPPWYWHLSILYYLIHNLVECIFHLCWCFLPHFVSEFIITWTLVMWKLSDPVTQILSREVLRDTSILWIKDVILKELIWDWAVVEAAQREHAMYCGTCVTGISKVSIWRGRFINVCHWCQPVVSVNTLTTVIDPFKSIFSFGKKSQSI